MAKSIKLAASCWAIFAWFAGILIIFASCVKDDQDDCGLNIRFRYTYNVKDADAFAHEVKSINLYAFDQDGKYIRKYTDAADKFATGYTMNIRDLHAGKYTFVCMARSEKAIDEDDQEFILAHLKTGDDIQNLAAQLDCDNGLNSKNFADLYIGKIKVDYSGNPQTATIDLMKCSNSYRIILLPTNKQANFTTENFDVRIVNANKWLDHEGNLLVSTISGTPTEQITHTPHNVELATNGKTSSQDGKEILQEEGSDIALIYDLSSARLFRDDNTRLIITDKRTGKVTFNHSLPWLLSLYGGEQRHKSWSDQEYLDRQDHYVLTFYVDDTRDYNFAARLKVNGWVLNLIDANID